MIQGAAFLFGFVDHDGSVSHAAGTDVSLELRNVSLRLRNVSFSLRNVSLRLRNVNFSLRNGVPRLRNAGALDSACY